MATARPHLLVLHGLGRDLALIVLGETTHARAAVAVAVGLLGLALVVAVHVIGTVYSHRRPDLVYRRTGAVIDVFRRPLIRIAPSQARYTRADVSPYLRVNGRPPRDPAYGALAEMRFAAYVLEVGGLMRHPLRLTLADLRRMPRETQVTLHCCIQGWSAIAAAGRARRAAPRARRDAARVRDGEVHPLHPARAGLRPPREGPGGMARGLAVLRPAGADLTR